MIRVIIVFSLLTVFSTPGSAGDGLDFCASDWGASCYGMRISICPQGDFEMISDGCGTGSDHLWVIVVNSNGNFVPGIPPTDFWIQACDPAEELCLCSSPISADGPTDENGYTEFSSHIAGGGCVLTGGLFLRVQGVTLVDGPACVMTTCVDIVIVSPDLNADCFVNLSDLGMFGTSYNLSWGQPGYDDCCDFNDDSSVNLSDFAFIAQHYQHECLD